MASVPAASSERTLPSASTATPTLRVAPKAISRAWVSFISRTRAKNSRSFGLEPGLPASMCCTPSASRRSMILILSSTEYEMPCAWAPSRSVES